MRRVAAALLLPLTSLLTSGSQPGWTTTGGATAPTALATLVSLGSGRAALLGGVSAGASPTVPLSQLPASPEFSLFDDGGWHAGATPAVAGGVGVELRDGRLLLVGATVTGSAPAAAVYSPSAARWSSTAAPSAPLIEPQLAALGSGALLIGGGDGHGGLPSGATQILNATTLRWTAGPALPVPVLAPAVVTLSDGSVVVIGGDMAGAPVTAVQQLSPGSSAWHLLAPLPQARSGAVAVALAGDGLLVLGGNGVDGPLGGGSIYSAASGWRSPSGLAAAPPGVGQSAALLPDGRVMVVGGVDGTDADGNARVSGAAASYAPSTDRWTVQPPLPQGRAYAAIAALSTGQVLVVGGAVGVSAASGAATLSAGGFELAPPTAAVTVGSSGGSPAVPILVLAVGVLVAGGLSLRRRR